MASGSRGGFSPCASAGRDRVRRAESSSASLCGRDEFVASCDMTHEPRDGRGGDIAGWIVELDLFCCGPGLYN